MYVSNTAIVFELDVLTLQDWPFPDGEPPPESIVKSWLQLIYDIFVKHPKSTECIAVHCVAGLGRYCARNLYETNILHLKHVYILYAVCCKYFCAHLQNVLFFPTNYLFVYLFICIVNSSFLVAIAYVSRAPVLVAIALIEKGMHALDAVQYIREKRRGAINRQQIEFLQKYKAHSGCVLL